MTLFRDGYIYRLMAPAQWEGLSQCEHIPYSPDDDRDGFFHMSTPAQALDTAARHYSVHPKLYAIGCPEGAPGDLLKWEPSRGGALFPHIHGDVDTQWFDHIVPLIRQGKEFIPSFGVDHP